MAEKLTHLKGPATSPWGEEVEFGRLVTRLHRWDRRRRLCDSITWGPRGILAGLLVAALIAAVARFQPLLQNEHMAILAPVLALVGLGASLAVIWMRRPSLLQQARFADRQFQMRERMSTAVEIHEQKIATAPVMAVQQLNDALSAADGVEDSTEALPLRFDRRDWLMILAAVALLLAAVFLPNAQSDALKRRQLVAQSIDEQIEAIESLKEEILQNPELSEERRQEMLEPLDRAFQRLEDGDLSQEGAVATLSEAEADLRELSDSASSFASEDLRRTLEDAGAPLTQNATGRALGDALQAGDLFSASQAASQLADSLAELSPEAMAELAEDLSAAASALAQTDSELAAELAAAADALRRGDVAAAQQALRDAAGTLQQRAQEAAAAAQSQAAADQLAQGREAVAQAGQGGQGQSGQGQATAGQGTGPGSAQNGAGTSAGAGQGEGSGTVVEQGEGTGGPGPGGGHAENLYLPPPVDLSSGQGIDVELPAECIANPANCGGLLSETPTEFAEEGSMVPYSQVFGDYRNAAYEALSEGHIPLGLRGYVRDYFSSLEP